MVNGVVSGANLNTQARKQVCNECVYATTETHSNLLPVEWLERSETYHDRYWSDAVEYALTLGCGLQDAPEDAFWCDGYAGDYSCDCWCNNPGEPTDRTVIPDGREHGINIDTDSKSVSVGRAGGWFSISTIDPADHETYTTQVTVKIGDLSFAEFYTNEQRAQRAAAIYRWLMRLDAPGTPLPGVGNERRLPRVSLPGVFDAATGTYHDCTMEADETRVTVSAPDGINNKWNVTVIIGADGFRGNYDNEQSARHAAARYRVVAGIEEPGADFWDAVR
jgi:hypothetical protein